MKSDAFLNLAHISGEIWGTQARVYGQPSAPGVQCAVLGHNVYFNILSELVAAYKREVTTDGDDPAETSPREDT
jgi:hypothetical protein